MDSASGVCDNSGNTYVPFAQGMHALRAVATAAGIASSSGAAAPAVLAAVVMS
jgi:hypothetical protein